MRATRAGIDLIGMVKEELLKARNSPGIWEGRLRDIERGSYSAAEFIARQKEMINDIVHSVMSDTSARTIGCGSDSSINTIKRKSVIEEKPSKK